MAIKNLHCGFEGILLKVSGKATSRWREKQLSYSKYYAGHEEYLSSLIYLLGSEDNTRSTLGMGVHTYSFACQLPHNCPSSFEGRYGSIRYVVKVTLIRPWKFDQTYTRGLSVLKTVDLNYEAPVLRLPMNSENYKTFCCGPFKTEPLKLELQVPQTCFVPGQNIPVSALIINNTNIAVSEINFSLVMLVRYFSTHPARHSRVESITIATAKGDSVLRNCTRSITRELSVPSTPPTCIRSCNIIQIVYQVEVEARMKGLHSKQAITMPIIIGNVPLWNSIVHQQPSSSRNMQDLSVDEDGENNAVCIEKSVDDGSIYKPEKENETKRSVSIISNALVNTPLHSYPDMPPPSYEESVHTMRGDINEDELHTFGPSEFAPLYPVYNFQQFNNSAPLQATNASQNGGYVNPSFVS
ncbi:arrestin domain-containing protein 17-like [Teleopsis dalmanni]|uniref:arrestin domain-containing protein 17-like n=1 Tax=Teleopsis dalmanni TaxID=139649 RepID=UPI0018CE5794|nr:arrestin domain-containing protein 17-like [Teleopsis dalmanni]